MTDAVHSNSQRPGALHLGNQGSSDSIGQYEESNLLPADSSKPDRFRLAGGPGLSGMKPQCAAAAT